jgi:hypothetical protein
MADPNDCDGHEDPYVEFAKLKNHSRVVLAIGKVNAPDLLMHTQPSEELQVLSDIFARDWIPQNKKTRDCEFLFILDVNETDVCTMLSREDPYEAIDAAKEALFMEVDFFSHGKLSWREKSNYLKKIIRDCEVKIDEFEEHVGAEEEIVQPPFTNILSLYSF